MREALTPTSESQCLHLPSVASAGLAPVMAERPVRECKSSKKCLKHFFDTLTAGISRQSELFIFPAADKNGSVRRRCAGPRSPGRQNPPAAAASRRP